MLKLYKESVEIKCLKNFFIQNFWCHLNYKTNMKACQFISFISCSCHFLCYQLFFFLLPDHRSFKVNEKTPPLCKRFFLKKNKNKTSILTWLQFPFLVHTKKKQKKTLPGSFREDSASQGSLYLPNLIHMLVHPSFSHTRTTLQINTVHSDARRASWIQLLVEGLAFYNCSRLKH